MDTPEQPPWFSSDIRHLNNRLYSPCIVDSGIIQLSLLMRKLKHLRHYYKKRLVKVKVNLTIHHL